jgi:ATP-binding cassette subfamily A (ABC1) protein 3
VGYDLLTGNNIVPSYLVLCPKHSNRTIMNEIVKMRDFIDSEWSAPFTIVNGVGAPSVWPLNWVGRKVPSFGEVTQIYDNADDLEEYVQSARYIQEPYRENPEIFAAIVVNSINVDGSWDYSLRLNGTLNEYGNDGFLRTGDNVQNFGVPMTDPPTNGNEPVQANVDPLKKEMTLNNQYSYVTRGFMTLQAVVDRYLICKAGNAACAPRRPLTGEALSETVAGLEFLVGMGSGMTGYGVIELTTDVRQRLVASEQYPPQDVRVMAMPIRPYTLYTFYEEVADIFPLIFILVNLMPVSTILSALVTEKETRMKEVMKMYGVTDSALSFSWLVTFSLNFVVVCVCTAACSTFELFPNSDYLLIFLFYLFFLLSIFGFCFMVSMLFDNARTAAVKTRTKLQRLRLRLSQRRSLSA